MAQLRDPTRFNVLDVRVRDVEAHVISRFRHLARRDQHPGNFRYLHFHLLLLALIRGEVDDFLALVLDSATVRCRVLLTVARIVGLFDF